MTEKSVLDWAEAEAKRLRGIGDNDQGSTWGYEARAHAAAGLEFLRRHAAGSEFQKSAELLFRLDHQMFEKEALDRLASILEATVKFIRDGMAAIEPLPVAARVVASTDLMEQAQALLQDGKVHPAAAVVLAGASLEEFLRSRIIAEGIAIDRPSLNSYATALRSRDLLTAQDVKDITSWSGQRNEAAHGEFDKLSRERALIMLDGINLFLRQKNPT